MVLRVRSSFDRQQLAADLHCLQRDAAVEQSDLLRGDPGRVCYNDDLGRRHLSKGLCKILFFAFGFTHNHPSPSYLCSGGYSAQASSVTGAQIHFDFQIYRLNF